MSIGDIPIYPTDTRFADNGQLVMYGMTYRQWLIGQALACFQIVVIDDKRLCRAAALQSIYTADTIIAELDREQTNDQERLRPTT